MKCRINLFLGLLFMYCSSCLGQSNVTKNGDYVYSMNSHKLVVKATRNQWHKIVNFSKPISKVMFSGDSRKIYYLLADTLFIQSLGIDSLTCIFSVSDFEQCIVEERILVSYLSNTEFRTIEIFDASIKAIEAYSNVTAYLFSPSGRSLLLKIKDSLNMQLWNVDVYNFNKTLISPDAGTYSNFCYDQWDTKLAFSELDSKTTDRVKNVFVFDCLKDTLILVLNNKSQGIPQGFELSAKRLLLSNSSDQLFLYLKEKPKQKTSNSIVDVDIWSYVDEQQQSRQLQDSLQSECLFAVSLVNNKIIQIENHSEIVAGSVSRLGDINSKSLQLAVNNETILNDKFILFKIRGEIMQNYMTSSYIMNEYNWNKATVVDAYLVKPGDSSRKEIELGIKSSNNDLPYFKMTPNKSYIVLFNPMTKKWVSYNINTGEKKVISNKIANDLFYKDYSSAANKYFTPRKIESWIGDSAMLVTDCFGDFWLVNYVGKPMPQKITNFWQLRNGYAVSWLNRQNSIRLGDTMFFKVINVSTKEESIAFLRVYLDCKLKYIFPFDCYSYDDFIKTSEFGGIFLIGRQNKVNPINYFFSSNYNRIDSMDELPRPNLEMCLNKELIRFKNSRGKEGFAVLYEPINFDRKKKYPVIFSYYENSNAASINSFEPLQHNSNGITPSFCATHGYLLCMVDIEFCVGNSGSNAEDWVVSAAKYLSRKKFVDASNMGIYGHSFGGFETYHIVSHSNLFAAACASSGMTDMISLYGSVENDKQGFSQSATVETGQVRLGVMWWDRPDIYIKNSPIFYVNKVNTPLLTMANKSDLRVPYNQGFEFFKALRRLGKPSWLIQYDEGKHGAGPKGTGEDWNIRMIQFFDHYLKGAPAPIWMTRGIPARLKGTTLGLEYDTVVKTPGSGLLMENKGALTPQQKKLLKHKTTVNNEGRIVDVVVPTKKKKVVTNRK